MCGLFYSTIAYINKKAASSFENVFEISLLVIEASPSKLFFSGSALERKSPLVIPCNSFIAHVYCYAKDTMGFTLLDVNFGYKPLNYQRFSIYLTVN